VRRGGPRGGEAFRDGVPDGGSDSTPYPPANYRAGDDGWFQVTDENAAEYPAYTVGHWIKLGVESETAQGKLYFQHFDAEQCKEFVTLLNAKRLRIGSPGHFYRVPFFIEVKDAAQS